MATYIMITKLTQWGRKTIKDNPNRIAQVNKEIEAMGGKVLAQYAVLGQFDFINVLEAEDNRTVARISMELASRGTVEIMTMPVVGGFSL